MRKINFTETVLRDANQSLIATRLPYEKFEPILETMDKAGYYSAEVWGGATFDVCLRYLHEDPSGTIRWSAGAAQRSTPVCAFWTRIRGSVCVPSAST